MISAMKQRYAWAALGLLVSLAAPGCMTAEAEPASAQGSDEASDETSAADSIADDTIGNLEETSVSQEATVADVDDAAAANTADTAAAKIVTSAAWSCRETSASVSGAKVSVAICWNGSRAKVAGQVYDTKGDFRSGCVLISGSPNGNHEYCDKGGAGTSKHIVTGEFAYTRPVLIAACTDSSVTFIRRCSVWH